MGRKKLPVKRHERTAVLITDADRAAVNKKVSQLLRKAEKHYGRKFEAPTEIRFNMMTKDGGAYSYDKNWIRLNPILYFENKEKFINSTVVHEVAHLTSKQRTNGKCKPHKKEWKEDMKLFGIDDPKTHHTYDTSSIPTVTRTHKVKLQQTKEQVILEDMEFLLARARRVRMKLPLLVGEEFDNQLYIMYEDYLHALDETMAEAA